MIVDPLPVAWRFEALGTAWRIDTPAPLAPGVRAAVEARIARFDADWSRFRDDSLVARIGREGGRHRLPGDAGPLLDWYRELYAATAGRVSPLVGEALAALGYDASYSLRPRADLPAVPAWEDAIAWDGEHLDAVRPVTLDVGAAGKGHLVDLVSDLLAAAGIPRHVVDASGDLRTRGVPLRIALENPANPAKAVGIAEIADGALCASAGNRRAWGPGLHHVLDAVTGRPTSDVLGTWVTAPTALVADGLATALFFDVDPGFARQHGGAFVRMSSDGRLEASAGFPGEVFA